MVGFPIEMRIRRAVTASFGFARLYHFSLWPKRVLGGREASSGRARPGRRASSSIHSEWGNMGNGRLGDLGDWEIRRLRWVAVAGSERVRNAGLQSFLPPGR